MEQNKHEDTEYEGVNKTVSEKETEQPSVEETIELDKTEELSEKLAEYQDRFLRLSAEFDNYRKRTLKERIELIKTAGEDIIKDLLPVLDDLDRAIEVMGTTDSVDIISEGTTLIANKLKSVLENKGLVALNPVGDSFDSDLHEAIAKTPVQTEQAGKITDVIQKGYSLNDKIIRHPKVVVGE